MPVTHEQLKRALTGADHRLDERVDVILVGGAAVIVLSPDGSSTRDIDALSGEGLSRLKRALAEAGTQGLELNDGADSFEVYLPQDWRGRLRLSRKFSTRRIKIYTPAPEDLAVMKVFRLAAKDADDIALLAGLPAFRRKRFLAGFLDVLPVAIGDQRHHAVSFAMVWNRLWPKEPITEEQLLRKRQAKHRKIAR